MKSHYKTVKAGDVQKLPRWYRDKQFCLRLVLANNVELHPLPPILQNATGSFVCPGCNERYYASVMIFVYVNADHTKLPIEHCYWCARLLKWHDITDKLLPLRHQG